MYPAEHDILWTIFAIVGPLVALALVGVVIYLAVRAALRRHDRDRDRDRDKDQPGSDEPPR